MDALTASERRNTLLLLHIQKLTSALSMAPKPLSADGTFNPEVKNYRNLLKFEGDYFRWHETTRMEALSHGSS